MEFLKNILGDKYEEFKGIIEAYNSENKNTAVKLADLSSGEYVSKDKYDNLKKEKAAAEATLGEAKKTIESLEASSGNNEQLQTEIANYKTRIEALETEAENTRKTYVVKESLSKAGIIDPDYVIYKQGGIGKFKFSKDNALENVDELIKELRDNKSLAHLFESQQNAYVPSGGGGGINNPFAKETLNMTEQGRLLRENPAQAKEMAAAAGININI